MILLTSLIA